MDEEVILNTVKKVILKSGRFSNVDNITNTTELIAEGFLDSLSMMSVLMELERNFKCSIPIAKINSKDLSTASNISTMLMGLEPA